MRQKKSLTKKIEAVEDNIDQFADSIEDKLEECQEGDFCQMVLDPLEYFASESSAFNSMVSTTVFAISASFVLMLL